MRSLNGPHGIAALLPVLLLFHPQGRAATVTLSESMADQSGHITFPVGTLLPLNSGVLLLCEAGTTPGQNVLGLWVCKDKNGDVTDPSDSIFFALSVDIRFCSDSSDGSDGGDFCQPSRSGDFALAEGFGTNNPEWTLWDPHTFPGPGEGPGLAADTKYLLISDAPEPSSLPLLGVGLSLALLVRKFLH